MHIELIQMSPLNLVTIILYTIFLEYKTKHKKNYQNFYLVLWADLKIGNFFFFQY